MKRLSRLRQLTEYLRALKLPESCNAGTALVVDQDNATAALSRASGDMLLIALPEISETGQDSDSFRSTLSAAFFALARVNGPARTQESADGAYDRLLDLVQLLLSRMEGDLSGSGCPLLAGLSLTDVQVVPQYSLFGGWSGWSVEMTFKG